MLMAGRTIEVLRRCCQLTSQGYARALAPPPPMALWRHRRTAYPRQAGSRTVRRRDPGGLVLHATDASPASAPSLWADLRAALRGTDADYTRIPLKRAVLLLAVPMMLELVLESTFAVVDIYFVARLGASAVATVGLTETYLFLLYSIAMGLAMAVTAIVARRVGEGRARRSGLVGRAGDRAGGAGVGAVRAGGHLLGPGPAAPDGRRRLGDRARLPVHAVDAGQQRDHPAAVRHQCDLPRCRRRGGGDARAVGGQCAEHRAGPAADLRLRAGAGLRRRGRCDRDHHRPRRRCADAALDPRARQRASARRPGGVALARCDDAADRAHLARRHRSDDRRDDGLDLPDAHPRERVHRSRRRRDHRDTRHDVHADAGLGHVECGGHPGRPEPRRAASRRVPKPPSGGSAG